ncbi:unnamed protein product [Coccothraustes coccothraustes]
MVHPWPRGALKAQGPCRDCATLTHTNHHPTHTRGVEHCRAPALSSDGGQAPPKELRLGFHLSKLHESKSVHFSEVASPLCTRKDAVTQSEHPEGVQGSRSRCRESQGVALLQRAKSAGACRLQRHQLCEVRPDGRSAQAGARAEGRRRKAKKF